ncbi:MAG: type IX secretion system sortase PorU [Bacteroidia bacterium]
MQKNIAQEPVDISLLQIKWAAPKTFEQQGKIIKTLSFQGVYYIKEKDFIATLPLSEVCTQGVKLKPIIQVVATQSLTPDEEASINTKYVTDNFDIVDAFAGTAKKITYMFCKLMPVRLNKATGKLEKLMSYRLQWQPTTETAVERNGNMHNKTQSFAANSVLANGNLWYKIGTAENAVYKIDKTLLQSILGNIDVSTINPQNIKIYGNGGEILSELNSDFHYDDLTENAIFVKDTGVVGTFDAGDYILFYGQDANKWKYAAGKNAPTRYYRNKHYYSDSVFYFLTVDNSPGKRINMQAIAASPVTNVVNTFDYYDVHDKDFINLVTSGREMYGENFDNNPSYTFNFPFPYLQNDTVWLQTDLAGRSQTGGAFNITYPGGQYSITFSGYGSGSDPDVAEPGNGTGATNFIYGSGTPNYNNSVNITVNSGGGSQSGWLNYIWVIGRRGLIMQGNQMGFRDYRCIGTNNISQFNIQSSAQNLRIWNVTDQFNISEQQTTKASNTYSFALPTDTLKQFIAFDGTSYKTPAFVGQVASQNLHSFQNVDYVIIAPQNFHTNAQKLADLHQKYEGLSYKIVTPDQIYNEFSSGVQDITAIRLFMRMLYKKPSSTPPQYLLLYGTGSYKQKDRYDPSNTVVIPTFETYNSYSYLYSKTSDDFYSFLDDNEGIIDKNGYYNNNLVDIGVGRLVVKNISEADAVANKIVHYYNRSEPTASCCDQSTQNTPDWRNWISLIADDANLGNPYQEMDFLGQQEIAYDTIQQSDTRYNVDKIYEDAYPVEGVPGGRRYPDVNTAINNRIAKGCLIMGYSGHGGELNLSHEDIININQINNWTNINNLPLFFTATCEFSRYDDPAQESAGEDVLLNPNGGGIGLFTTTRLAFITDGHALVGPFYSAALRYNGGKRPALGDIIRLTKFSQPNELHFSLLGDPAVTLSYPKQNTGNLSINSHVNSTTLPTNDTLSALAKYTVKAFIADNAGNKLTSFNGTMYITVFDKPALLTTLNNSQNTPASTYLVNFYQQKSIIYKGKASVVNGDFTYNFIVPKDIAYNFGNSKISYYAQSDTTDAAGYNINVIVGGTSSNPVIDHQGPGINLYMNDNHFVSGGTTNQSPFIYALLSDSSGINTSGNGLGHDLTAVLDANTPHEVVLNDYYQANLNKYQSGKILYQLQNLPTGNHSLTLKAWDVLDNSSLSSTDFVVATNSAMALTHVLNYPNPFTTATKFFVEHNQACDVLNVEVQIYTITGKVVKTILQTVQNQGFRTEGISWDGRDDFGDKLARGVYIYKVLVKNSEGSHAQKIEKLVILN